MNFRNLLVQLGLVAGNAAAKWDPSGVASLLLDAYGKKREKDHLRAEIEAMMRADFQQFRAQLQDAMGDLRLQLAESVRAQVEAYLSQFQASARQAARHLGDSSATTVPATVGVDDPQQLAAFLPQRPPQFTVGSVVPGLPSWVLTEPLGAGGFGEVWKARHEDDGIVAAFKFFLDPTARSRFTAAEAKVLKEIHQKAPHNGVVKLIQAEARQDPPWIQFEYIPGGDLSRLPESWAKLPTAERVTRAQEVVRSLATTVGHFHNLGVVHRDLKPSNVLLRVDGSLVVADFGISRILPAESGTAPTPTNSALATIRAYTPVYASPQQKKFLPADRRDDVYALAVLWYQLLRGDFSFERPGGDGWKVDLARMGVSEDAVKLLNRSWDDNPDARPKDGNDLAAMLVAGVAKRALPRAVPTVQARPAPPLPERQRERGREEEREREAEERKRKAERNPRHKEDEDGLPSARYEKAPSPVARRRRLPTWLWIVGGVCLMVCGITAVMVYRSVSNLASSRVPATLSEFTEEHFRRLNVGMPEAEVIAIFGKPTEVRDQPNERLLVAGPAGSGPVLKRTSRWVAKNGEWLVEFHNGVLAAAAGRAGGTQQTIGKTGQGWELRLPGRPMNYPPVQMAGPGALLREPLVETIRPTSEPPLGAETTAYVGQSPGGGRRWYVPGGQVVSGIGVRTGDFGGAAIAQVVPVTTAVAGPQYQMAPTGYALGGLTIQAREYVLAVRPTFFKLDASGRLDPNDKKVGEWMGFPDQPGSQEAQLGDSGRRVLGIASKEGLILDGLALVMEGPGR